MNRAGAQDDDAASTLDLLSPGAFKGDVAGMVAALNQQQNPNPSAGGEGGGGGEGGRERLGPSSSSPSMLVVSSSKEQLVAGLAAAATAGGSPPRGAKREGEFETRHTREDARQREGLERLGEEKEQEKPPQATPALVPRSSSSSSLREEEWHMPPVLLTSLEANGVMLPTPLQEAVWKGGRGRARADLIVHVRVCCLLWLA